MLVRILSGLIGFPLVVALLVLGNQFVIDIAFAIVGVICLYEFYNVFKEKNIKPIKWIGYVVAAILSIIHIVPQSDLYMAIKFTLPILIIILFIQCIITKMKYNIVDIAVSIFGIIYVVGFIMFIPLIRGLNYGQFYIWYLVFAAWGTDTFAYFVGVAIGKHKFTLISPKKTVEGSIGGIIGSTLICLIYTYCINKFAGLNLDYMYIIVVSAVLSIFSQIGDLSASSIKRYTNTKDFGNLIPGHGGLLDRIDSLIFIAPIVYLFFM